jgi:hypothetical protein
MLTGPTVPPIDGDISKYEQRFAQCRKSLPATGTVGYISDTTDPFNRDKRWYLAQYALAPLVLKRETSYPVVLGNFESSESGLKNIPHHLALLRDCGNGVMVFRGRRH